MLCGPGEGSTNRGERDGATGPNGSVTKDNNNNSDPLRFNFALLMPILCLSASQALIELELRRGRQRTVVDISRGLLCSSPLAV